jgi:hypothetical protein
MPHAEQTRLIAAMPDVLWRQIGSFGSVAHWHPMLDEAECDGESVGARRKIHAKDGTFWIERLRALMPRGRGYRYSVEAGTMPVSNYVSELRVEDNGDGTSIVTWSSDFDVIDDNDLKVVTEVEDFFKTALVQLKHFYG